MVTETATEMDARHMVIEATAVTATGARATAAMAEAIALMVDKELMEPLTTPDLLLLLLLLIKTPKLSTTTLSTPSGPLTMLRTLPRIPTQPTVASRLSWPSTHKQVLPSLLQQQATVHTMVKLTPSHSRLLLVLVLVYHRRLHLTTRATELRHHHRLLLLPLQVATVRYV